MTLRRLIILNLVMPVVLALYYALARSNGAAEASAAQIFAVYCLSGTPMYLFALGGSLGFRHVLQRNWWPAALLGGAVVAVLFGYFYLNVLVLAITAYSPWLAGGLTGRFPLFEGLAVYLFGGATLLLPAIWMLANFIYEAVTGEFLYFTERSLRRGTREVEVAPRSEGLFPTSAVPSGFLSKLDDGMADRMIAIEAQEHYVRVHGKNGSSKLVLYRFGDAVSELEGRGVAVQVHRSYCVLPKAIQKISRQGRSQKIVLDGGLEVPVSQSYRAILQRLEQIHAS